MVDAQRQGSELSGARSGGDVLIGQRRVAAPRVQERGHGVDQRKLPYLIGVVGERDGDVDVGLGVVPHSEAILGLRQ